MISLPYCDPGIICFQHCITKVFCFNLPENCPTCSYRLNELVLKLMPFRLPYPFIKAFQYPCSVVLRPTSGDFLNDYNNSTDLHIAATTSNGTIVEFDRNGLQRHSAKSSQTRCWTQCLLVESVPEFWYDTWDTVLMQICKQNVWTMYHYDEDSYNCYTFVLKFLQILGYDTLSVAAQSKTKFCEKFIVPRTTTAGKYISLYRKIRDNGLYTHPVKDLLHANKNTTSISRSNNAASLKVGGSNGDGTTVSPNSTLNNKLCTIKE